MLIYNGAPLGIYWVYICITRSYIATCDTMQTLPRLKCSGHLLVTDVVSSCTLVVSFSADSVCFSLLAFSSDGAADGTAGSVLVFVFEVMAVGLSMELQ